MRASLRFFERILSASSATAGRSAPRLQATRWRHTSSIKPKSAARPYENITSLDHIWPLIKPQKWIFGLGSLGRNLEFKSRVIIDFGWPNPHDLVAYLADTELLLLHVEG